MIRKAKDLSPDQKTVLEGLLGRAFAEDEAVSIWAVEGNSAPDWLEKSWESAQRMGLDILSSEEIDAEIAGARKERLNRSPSLHK